MAMILYEGRPADASGRLPREMRTYDFLDKLEILTEGGGADA